MTTKGKYLNPKADITFKKVFGEHEELVMSLLNALLPLDEGKRIEHVEYMPTELMPETPTWKNSIVDVRCRESGGRHFIVEMQMNWNHQFQRRVILNASKAVVKQLKTGDDYLQLKPVYSLNLINDVGFDAGPDEFYHDYAIVNVEHTDRIIDGLRFVFVELPKFKPQSIAEKKMTVLWLKFLTEINESTEVVDAELLENPETAQALQILEQSAYSEEEMDAYDKYWMSVTDERVIMEGKMQQGYEKGIAEGRAEGRAEGMAEGRVEGINQNKRDNARKMKALGATVEFIQQVTGLSAEVISAL